MYFLEAVDAQQHKDYQGDLPAGEYYIYEQQDKAYNLTTKNGENQKRWINIDDNIPSTTPQKITDAGKSISEVLPEVLAPAPMPAPPVTPIEVPAPDPEPLPPAVPVSQVTPAWQRMTWLRPDHQAVKYVGRNKDELQIHDLSRQQPDIPMIAQKPEVWIVGWFVGPDGAKYYRTAGSTKQRLWYGIPVTQLQKESIFNYATSLAERIATHTTKLGDQPAIVLGKGMSSLTVSSRH